MKDWIMSANNSNRKFDPVVVLREEPSISDGTCCLLPALFGSVIFHAALVVVFVAYVFCR